MTGAHSPPLTYADLERRYTGPIPQEALDRLRYGSSLNAEIARVEDEMHFFRRLHGRTIASVSDWLTRDNHEMHDANRRDAALYFRQWRALRARLPELRGTNAAVKGAGRFFEALDPKGRGDG